MGEGSLVGYVALIGGSVFAGFWLGSKSWHRETPSSRLNLPPKQGNITHADDEGRARIQDNSEFIEGQNGTGVGDLAFDESKMVLVVRTDLGMSSGKIAAQHATLACYKSVMQSNPTLLRKWELTGQTKIALRCSNEEELLSLQSHARKLNLCAQSIRDAGRTQIAAGSRTVLGILGPARVVNQVTGKLRML